MRNERKRRCERCMPRAQSSCPKFVVQGNQFAGHNEAGTTVRLGRKRAGESSALRVLKYLVLKFEAGSILLRLGGSQCITTFL